MECFVNTPAGSWAAANAWKFGFIVRYPPGAQAVTGYAYEPWHLRHVGRATASEMHHAGVPTLEAYLAGSGRTTAD
jgi:D-alanyl-D-alanine carboxypeptidase